MNKTTSIIILVLFFILLGGIVFLYYNNEKPEANNIQEYVDFSVVALDNNKNIKTGFLVYLENNLFLNSTTETYSPILVKIPLNRTITLFNYNINNQTYYSDEINKNTLNKETKRIKFDLVKRGKLNITQNGIFGEDNPIYLKLQSGGLIKNINFCVKVSSHIIYVKSNSNFKKDFLCFNTNKTLNNNDMSIKIKYEIFGKLDKNDFVKINIYSLEEINNKLNKNFIKQYVIKK